MEKNNNVQAEECVISKDGIIMSIKEWLEMDKS